MSDVQNENGQVVKKETTEVIDNGVTLNSQGSSLAGIFDKIVAGKEEGVSAAETIKSIAVEPEKKVEKKEEKVDEKKEVIAEKSDLDKKLEENQKKRDDDGEVSREKLRTATEEKKEEKKVEEKKTEDDVPEDELKVLPHDKPKTAKRIQALLKKIDDVTSTATETKKQAEEKATKLAELEKKLSEQKPVDPLTDERVKSQLDELSMLRRRYELDKDPEVKKKYDERSEHAEKSINDTLVKRNAGEPLLKLIKEEGGWARFSEGSRIITIPDGEGGTKQVTTSELADTILQALPLGERKNIEAAMIEQVQTKRDRERYLKEQQDTAVEYFKKKDEDSQKGTAEYQRQVEEGKKLIEDYKKKTLESEWIKDKDIPEKATPVEKAAIEEHNKYNGQLRSVFNKAVGTKSLPELLEIVTDSVRYYDERRVSSNLRKENDKLKADLDAKQKEIDRFKAGGRTVPKAGSIATAPDKTASERGDKPSSLEDAFDRIERGESVGRNRRDEE